MANSPGPGRMSETVTTPTSTPKVVSSVEIASRRASARESAASSRPVYNHERNSRSCPKASARTELGLSALLRIRVSVWRTESCRCAAMSARSASRFSRSFARVFSWEVLTQRGMIATPKERIREPPRIAPRAISHGDCPRNEASTNPLATKIMPARVIRMKSGFFHECARVLCVHTAAIPPRTRTAAAISRSPAIPVKSR